jgi:hypothetical protein
MRVVLDVPYVDTTAAELGFALGLSELPAVHVLDLPDALGPGSQLQLRLLGASHQVVLTTPAGLVSETVACRPDVTGRLPTNPVTRPYGDGGGAYAFTATVTRLAGADFDARVRALAARAGDPRTVVGEFPGAPGALTVIAADVGAGGVAWRTAHAYPQTRELVLTRTRVTIGGPR